MKLDFQSIEPTMSETSLDTLRIQALKIYKRKQVMVLVGMLCIAIICVGGWLYFFYEPPLEPIILEQAGSHLPDTVEESQVEASISEEKPMVTVQVMDDGPLYLAAEEAFLHKNWELAIQKQKELIALYPNDHTLWFNLALAYHYHKDLDQARYWYEKILMQDPHHPPALRNLKILNTETA